MTEDRQGPCHTSPYITPHCTIISNFTRRSSPDPHTHTKLSRLSKVLPLTAFFKDLQRSQCPVCSLQSHTNLLDVIDYQARLTTTSCHLLPARSVDSGEYHHLCLPEMVLLLCRDWHRVMAGGKTLLTQYTVPVPVCLTNKV